ncbi:ankyrin repeat domain-containing protein [Chitinispirillales bacterium ANBcel5]|uniref:ankyrin repeat domain-containing protein n=1 Tax=Cellulosispirillum alkaliphilum TaxID=3039283 RepID=UPI002A535EE0|nr:ankyrin repeat domain-containing protein [Chitinispirillales bacterium ANBcel5]
MKLLHACTRGNLGLAKELICAGENINITDKSGRTALIEAAWSGNTELVTLLLENAAEVNSADRSGFTALMRAAEEGYEPIVNILIRNGADVNCCGKVRGTTPLMLAAENGNIRVIQKLLKAGAKINTMDLYEETALAKAYRTNQLKAIEYLEASGGRGKPERSSYSMPDREIRTIPRSALQQFKSTSLESDIIDDDIEGLE